MWRERHQKKEVDEASMRRFWEKVDRSGGPESCWNWLGSINSSGYGRFKDDLGSSINASRFALQIAIGRPATIGLEACHTCDNRLCVNPNHLFAGTRRDNMSDMARKGRSNRGKRICPSLNGRKKISPDQVGIIKARISSGESNSSIAKDFPVGASMISRIRTGRSWQMVGREGLEPPTYTV